jgi:ADP-ribose pyrophosphatase YjhB (NUDIX family)
MNNKSNTDNHGGADSCDHTSVGMLVWKEEKLLLIERKKVPFGFAPPAGHVDNRASYEIAADSELFEEVGLSPKRRTLVAEGRQNNACRRVGGSWHYWKIYKVEVVDYNVSLSIAEAKQIKWCSLAELKKLTLRTEQYLAGEIHDKEWAASPGLEPVWREWLKQLHIV